MGDCDMAAKKKIAARRASDKPRKANELRQSLKKARDEIANFVQHKKAGRLTDRQLKTGLKEVEGHLERVLAFKKAFL
jgi:hypothetical protein